MVDRFILFEGSDYYPEGGAHDSPVGFASVEEARVKGEESMKQSGNDWFHVFDLQDWCIVSHGRRKATPRDPQLEELAEFMCDKGYK